MYISYNVHKPRIQGTTTLGINKMKYLLNKPFWKGHIHVLIRILTKDDGHNKGMAEILLTGNYNINRLVTNHSM